MPLGRGGRVRDEESRQGMRVLGVTTLGLMFVIINASSVNVALPSMSEDFDVRPQTADWFLLAFMLANTAAILSFGRISDMLGRKRIYLWGLAAFVVLSVLAAFAPTAGTLIALRVLQGIAAATTVTNTAALIADAFPSHLLAYGLSLNLTAAAVGNSIGPTVGGFLITLFGWQAIFLINVPFGVAAVALGMRVLPADRARAGPRDRFDFLGAVLSAAGLAAVLYGVNQISGHGIGDPRVALWLGSGAALLAGFVVAEMRSSHPLVDIALVRTFSRACAYGAAYFNSFSRAGLVILVVLQQQIVGHRSAAEAGFVIMVMAIAMMVAAPVSGRLSNIYTARTLSFLGAAGLVIGCAGLMLSVGSRSLVWVSIWLLLAGAGIGLFTTPNSTAIMSGIAPNRRATANAIRSVLFNSGQAIGTTIALLLVAGSGVESYADQVDSPQIRAGFQAGYAVFLGSAVIAMVLAVSRGGPWRAVPDIEAPPVRARVAADPRNQ
ncbi:MAG: Drug resistance transporter, EmrB/QacA subfamily [Pseudonocardiales bacterium]|nr:Drug resistance transporter, EmrB/QacA subfamily [Pseudonocardiales bacterium]